MRILLVEDNETIIQGLRYFFEKNGYELVMKTRIRQVVEYMDAMPEVDLIILDVTLPDGNGFDLFRNEIRDREIPTIFLTARDDEESVVKGLTIGAEDYITKPFSTKELLARMNKILMRTKRNGAVTVSDITFDMDKMVVTRSGHKVELSALELKILSLLFLSLNKVVTRNTILDKIWEWTGNDVDDHTVTVYMKRIREKLQTDIIITVKGIGYRIDDGA